MNRRSFFRLCLASAAAMLTPAARAMGADIGASRRAWRNFMSTHEPIKIEDLRDRMKQAMTGMKWNPPLTGER